MGQIWDPFFWLLGTSSSHLPSLSLGCSGPCGKSRWSRRTSPPCCIRAVCLGAAYMLQVGTSWCFCWSWGLSLKPFWRNCTSAAWTVLLLASTYFTVNWNLNGITWNQIRMGSVHVWALQEEPGQALSIFLHSAACISMVLAVASCSVARALSREHELFSFISPSISHQPVASLQQQYHHWVVLCCQR